MNYSIFLHKLVVLLALSIAANLDNLGVGIAYGMGRNRISNFSNFLIALLSAVLTFLAMMFGRWVQRLLPVQVANDLGAVIIVGVGFWVAFEPAAEPLLSFIRSFLVRNFSEPLTRLFSIFTQAWQRTDRSQTVPPINIPPRTFKQSRSRLVSLKETLILGISLALNAMAGGFGASLAGHNALFTSLGIGIVSYLTIDSGQRLSKTYFSKSLGPLSQKVAGLLLILIGVYELIF